jgi:hypothetical protein
MRKGFKPIFTITNRITAELLNLRQSCDTSCDKLTTRLATKLSKPHSVLTNDLFAD